MGGVEPGSVSGTGDVGDRDLAAETGWRRGVLLLARLEPSTDPSGLVYGMIIASVVITAQTQYGAGAGRVLVATALTVGVYWLTHVYCHVLAHTLRSRQRATWSHIGGTLRAEASVLWGGGVELGAVVMALLLGFGANGADWVAICVAIVLLFCWGLIAGVRSRSSTGAVLLDAVLGAALGAMVALLKLLLK